LKISNPGFKKKINRRGRIREGVRGGTYTSQVQTEAKITDACGQKSAKGINSNNKLPAVKTVGRNLPLVYIEN